MGQEGKLSETNFHCAGDGERKDVQVEGHIPQPIQVVETNIQQRVVWVTNQV